MGNDQPKGSIEDRIANYHEPQKAVSEKPEAVLRLLNNIYPKLQNGQTLL